MGESIFWVSEIMSLAFGSSYNAPTLQKILYYIRAWLSNVILAIGTMRSADSERSYDMILIRRSHGSHWK